MQNKEVIFQDWGTVGYQEAWDKQEGMFAATVAIKTQNRGAENPQPTPNYLVFVEHPHVYTLGKSGKPENLLLDDVGLSKYQAEYHKINRGGDITYHGPGQLVGYPILDLDNFFTDIHKYMRFLEEAVIQTLAYFGISATRYDGLTGVWLDAKKPNARKICAMGVKCSRWVTMHGIALNVNPDLTYFNHIVPCGIEDKAVTSMAKEMSSSPDMNEVQNILTHKMSEVFQFEIIA